jgi:two-component system, OmpR family, sensor histidine kinase CiaH
LLIIMLISSIFSLTLYTIINQEYSRIEKMQKDRQEKLRLGVNPYFEQFRQERAKQGQQVPPILFSDDPAVINEARIRLLAILVLANLGILIFAGIAGYFLAGRTLRPIKEMIEKQNQFITDASHELRTPLTSLKTSIEVYFRSKNHTLLQSDKLLSSNLEEVNNLQYLSDNLIKLSNPQKAQFNLIFEDLELRDVLEEALKKVASQAKQRNIKIINRLRKSIILGDRQSLTELFVVILDNAIKYSFKNKSVSITSENDNNHVIIKIKDEGIGIENKDIPHIFDRFYRADRSRTKENIEGYGLGLSIAKQIIDNHNGNVEVESNPGKGTIFSIQLPVKS